MNAVLHRRAYQHDSQERDERCAQLIANNKISAEIIKQLMAQKAELTQQVQELTQREDNALAKISQLGQENHLLEQKVAEWQQRFAQSHAAHSDAGRQTADMRAFGEKIIFDARVEADRLRKQAAEDCNQRMQRVDEQIDRIRRSAAAEMAIVARFAESAKQMAELLAQTSQSAGEELERP